MMCEPARLIVTSSACKPLIRSASSTARLTASTAASGLTITPLRRDRKSTRLNSSHSQISYAVFCLKKTTNYFSVLGVRPFLQRLLIPDDDVAGASVVFFGDDYLKRAVSAAATDTARTLIPTSKPAT